MRKRLPLLVSILIATTLFGFNASAHRLSPPPAANVPPGPPGDARFVSGSWTHFFTTAIIHSTEPTATGMIQRSTDTVDLTGDLVGRILYHPVSEFDFVNGTLVNTGHQVFSGTVLGSDPVLLYDDSFRFEVDLSSGATTGEVHLTDSLAGPAIRCHLDIVGTGMTAEGNATFDYTGECRSRSRGAGRNLDAGAWGRPEPRAGE
jgi:hypothetical protein